MRRFQFHEKAGEATRVTKSPVASLQRAANERDAVLVIDQLDAISLMSGRLPNSYDAVADLIDEAMAEGIRVIVACRLFDLENDHEFVGLLKNGRLSASLLMIYLMML